MKTGLVCAAVIAVLVLGFAGCKKKEPQPAQGQQTGAGTALQDVQKETGEALETAGQYLAQEKDKLVASAGKQLSVLEKELQDLEAAAAAKGGQARIDFDKMKPELDRQTAVAKVKLEEAKQAGAKVWDSTKAGMNDALVGLQKAYDNAKAKVAP